MTAVEDETDVQAAKVVAAEQKAELAEFDENIPWDERESENKKEREEMSKVEQELAMLQKEVKWFDRALILVHYVSSISNCSFKHVWHACYLLALYFKGHTIATRNL